MFLKLPPKKARGQSPGSTIVFYRKSGVKMEDRIVDCGFRIANCKSEKGTSEARMKTGLWIADLVRGVKSCKLIFELYNSDIRTISVFLCLTENWGRKRGQATFLLHSL